MYNVFIYVFSITLQFQKATPLIKSFQPEKKTAEKHWLTKELREETTKKHRLFNIWKEQANTIFKYQRNFANRRLKTAQNEFCKQFFIEQPTRKEQLSFIKKELAKKGRVLL